MFNQTDFEKFDKIFDEVKPDLKGLSFCKQVKKFGYNQKYFTYGRSIKYQDFIYYHIGFGHNEEATQAWYYLTFLFYKKKCSQEIAQKVAQVLPNQPESYHFNHEAEENYRVVAVHHLNKNWTSGNVISAQEITNWFKERIQEVKDKEETISIIINQCK